MDRNAYRDDNGTDQLRTLGNPPRTHAEPLRLPGDHPRTPGDPREEYPGPREEYPGPREEYPDQPDTYWRRRAITLAAGLGVLGLLAWAFSGGGGGSPAPAPHDSPAAAAGTYPSAQASPAAGTGTGTSASASPGAGADAAIPGLASHGTSGLPSATTSPAAHQAKADANANANANAGANAGAKTKASAKTKTNNGATQGAASTEPGGRCSPSSVVLSLFSGSRSYRAGQDPQFDVNAVSTAAGTCTFGLGPSQLHLVVMSAGRVIWDSADCARGDATQSVKLTRGVPVPEYFTWNRSITLPGCVTLASSARPGSYQAQARTSAISSATFTFRLER